jgi:hypothetical protein
MAESYGESAVRPFTSQQRHPTAAADTNDYFDQQARPTTSSRNSAVPAGRHPSFSGAARPMTSGRPMTSRPGTAQQGVPEWLFQENRPAAKNH